MKENTDSSRGGPPLQNASPEGSCEATHDCDASHEHAHAHHRETFRSHELRVPDDLDPDGALAWIGARRGLRTKGFVRTTAGVRIVQGVGRRLELAEPGDMLVPEALLGRVVVIVRAE